MSEVVLKGFADYEKIHRENEKLRRDLVKTKQQLGAVRQESKAGAQAGREQFGAGMLNSVRSMITSVASLAGAIGMVKSAWGDAAQAATAAGEAAKAVKPAYGELLQLAVTKADPDKAMKEYVARTQKFFEMGGFGKGAEGMTAAAGAVFALESAEVPVESQEMIAQAKSIGMVHDPAMLARAATTMRTSFGEAETGNMEELVAKIFAASSLSPSRAEELAEAAAASGTMAREMGVSDEEILAAVGKVAKAKGGADVAGTFVAQMMRTLESKGTFKGQSLADTIAEVEKMRAGGEDVFGTQDAVKRMVEMREGMTSQEAEAFLTKQQIELAKREKQVKKGTMGKVELDLWKQETLAPELAAKGMSPGEFKEWFGRAQGKEAYQVLANDLEDFKRRTALVTEQRGKQVVPEAAGVAQRTLPGFEATQIAEQEEAKKFLQHQEKLASPAQLFEAGLNRMEQKARAEGAAEASISFQRSIAQSRRWAFGDEYMLERFAEQFREEGGGGEVGRSIDKYLRGQARQRSMMQGPKLAEWAIEFTEGTGQAPEAKVDEIINYHKQMRDGVLGGVYGRLLDENPAQADWELNLTWKAALDALNERWLARPGPTNEPVELLEDLSIYQSVELLEDVSTKMGQLVDIGERQLRQNDKRQPNPAAAQAQRAVGVE